MSRKNQRATFKRGRGINGNLVVPPTLLKNAIDILVSISLQPICTDLESKKEPAHLKKTPHQTPLLKLLQKIGS